MRLKNATEPSFTASEIPFLDSPQASARDYQLEIGFSPDMVEHQSPEKECIIEKEISFEEPKVLRCITELD